MAPTDPDYAIQVRLGTLKKRLLEAKRIETEPLMSSFHALTGAVDFIDSFEDMAEEGLGRPLGDLLAALLDLRRGARPELLQPKPIQGRPPRSHPERHLRIMAAIAMEAYMQAGLSRNDAASRTARWFPLEKSEIDTWRYKLTGPKPSKPSEIYEWERFQSGLKGIEILKTNEKIKLTDIDEWAKTLANEFRDNPPS